MSPGRPGQPVWCSGSTARRGGTSALFEPITGTAAVASAAACSAVIGPSAAPQCTIAGSRPPVASRTRPTPSAVSTIRSPSGIMPRVHHARPPVAARWSSPERVDGRRSVVAVSSESSADRWTGSGACTPARNPDPSRSTAAGPPTGRTAAAALPRVAGEQRQRATKIRSGGWLPVDGRRMGGRPVARPGVARWTQRGPIGELQREWRHRRPRGRRRGARAGDVDRPVARSSVRRRGAPGQGRGGRVAAPAVRRRPAGGLHRHRDAGHDRDGAGAGRGGAVDAAPGRVRDRPRRPGRRRVRGRRRRLRAEAAAPGTAGHGARAGAGPPRGDAGRVRAAGGDRPRRAGGPDHARVPFGRPVRGGPR